MNDWNGRLYSKFENQRTQPAKDLINSLEVTDVGRILDLGCGPGNSTETLYSKWPTAEIIGIDSSENMLAFARGRLENISFYLVDATGDLGPFGKFDIIFSNAAIQWMPDQVALFNNLFRMLRAGGVLAVQIPNVHEMAITKAIFETVSMESWKPLLSQGTFLFMHDPSYYYSICTALSGEFYIWVTNYIHVMQSHEAIFTWYRSTGLKPYYDQLDASLHKSFEHDLMASIVKHYPQEPDGQILFPFTRQFITIYKSDR